MKKIISSILLSCILFLGIFSIVDAKTITVKSYYKPSTGKFVQSYQKTSPNKTKVDNWSTKGNINPVTGKKGTVKLW